LVNINPLFLITLLVILILDIIRKIMPILQVLKNNKNKWKLYRFLEKIIFWIELFIFSYLMAFIQFGKIYVFIIVVFFILFVFLWPFISNVLIYYLIINENKKKSESNDLKNKINNEFNNSIDVNKEKEYPEKSSDIYIKELLKIFTKDFSDIKSFEDIFYQLPKENFIDITNSNEIKRLNAVKDKRITNKFYKFSEINSELGELDIDFFNKELANIRIQLFDNNYTPEKIKQFINKLININWNNNNKLPRLFLEKYKYVGIFNDRLVIGIREIKNSISIAITHIKYF
jgi:hypothetical protein